MEVRTVKSKVIYLIVLVLSVLLGGFYSIKYYENPLNQNESFDYKIYYNTPTKELINKMQKLDAIILEPHFYTVDQIREIKEKGTTVYGYINTMEIDSWNKSIVNKVKPADYFYRNNEKVYFDQWDSYLADFTSNHYRELLLNEIANEIISKQIDGIFLDTVGDIDDQHSRSPGIYEEQQLAMFNFVKDIHSKYPDKKLIQNWGFQTLENYTAPYIDGVMWEDFDYTKITSDSWSQQQIETLQNLKEKYDLQIYTVSFKEPDESKRYAVENGFYHLHTTSDFEKW
ncbi:putative glycoside hydrolase [Halobacillus litoralis]|uniref:putative glycoside hydrolase n=1 Tax=Halobacillus litoralis TaxID=45668 RepID=UPI001CFDB221|nr:putative glycoside hydrolase [Halobacillus litoralis]